MNNIKRIFLLSGMIYNCLSLPSAPAWFNPNDQDNRATVRNPEQTFLQYQEQTDSQAKKIKDYQEIINLKWQIDCTRQNNVNIEYENQLLKQSITSSSHAHTNLIAAYENSFKAQKAHIAILESKIKEQDRRLKRYWDRDIAQLSLPRTPTAPSAPHAATAAAASQPQTSQAVQQSHALQLVLQAQSSHHQLQIQQAQQVQTQQFQARQIQAQQQVDRLDRENRKRARQNQSAPAPQLNGTSQ